MPLFLQKPSEMSDSPTLHIKKQIRKVKWLIAGKWQCQNVNPSFSRHFLLLGRLTGKVP